MHAYTHDTSYNMSIPQAVNACETHGLFLDSIVGFSWARFPKSGESSARTKLREALGGELQLHRMRKATLQSRRGRCWHFPIIASLSDQCSKASGTGAHSVPIDVHGARVL